MTFSGRTYTGTIQVSNQKRFNLGKIAIWVILFLLAADAIYSAWNGINMQTRNNCVIHRSIPHWLFLTNEYFIELFMVVVAGAFTGTVAEKFFTCYRKLFPKNQITAFVYASVIPVCSCSAIPMIESMKKRLPLRTLVTFVIAAPLLNPYIIFLSYSVLGMKYGTLRIIGSFLVSMLTGLFVEWVYIRSGKPEIGIYKSCEPAGCDFVPGNDVYRKTWKMIGKIAPYILVAGLLGMIFELTGPVKLIEQLPLNGSIVSLLLVTLIGIPIYFCNGADVLFLSPLLTYTDIGLGAALAFSITSTAICASSIVMLSKFLGEKLTVALVGAVMIITLIFSYSVGVLVP
jgi:uncharacterized protein